MLGLGEQPVGEAPAKLGANADARAQVLLGMVLAALEGRTPKDALARAGNYPPAPGPGDYLRLLAANGYSSCGHRAVITGERVAE